MANYKKLTSGWQIRFYYENNYGEKVRKTMNGFRVKGEAANAMNNFLSQLSQGKNFELRDTQLVDYFNNWVKRYKEKIVSKITLESYKATSKQLSDFFGKQTIATISRDRYQDFLTFLAEKGMAKATIRKKHNYVKAIETLAVEDGIIMKRFTRNTIISGADSKKEDTKFLDLADFKKIIQLSKQRANLKAISQYIILVQAYTGLRFEEALGLTWNDIDFESMEMNIHQSWMYKNKDGGFGPLKNKSSERKISFNKNLEEILLSLKKEQQLRYMKLGYRDKNNLVFRNWYLEMVGNDATNDTLTRLCNACGVKRVTTHALRHTHGSVLIYEGVDLLVVSKRLGHKDLQTTLSTYAHVIGEMQKRADKKTATILDNLSL